MTAQIAAGADPDESAPHTSIPLPRRTPHQGIGWVLALVAALAVVFYQRDVGIARDEVVYIHAGARYADWWIGLVSFDHGVSEASITKTFGGRGATDNNREHPPVMKTLFGLSDRLLHRTLGICDEVTASRVPSALLHGLLVLLVYLMVLELWGFSSALLAGVLVIALPRAMFHAGLACFDAPIMALWFAAIYAYWRCLDGRRWPWQAGVVWGLALATKHNALLLPFAFGLHYLVVAARARAAGRLTWRTALAERWRVVASLAVLGPATLIAVWPWLWLHPSGHIADWLTFHLRHVHYNFEYLGVNWNAPRFPWHVALITTLFTVPVATLASAIAGAGVWIAQRTRRDPKAPAILLALSAAASIGPFLLGTTPIFGAEKHWMPALPTICIAAAVGCVWAARRAAGYLAARWGHLAGSVAERRLRRIAICTVSAGVVLAGAVETDTASPYALSWYNALAGGAPGGADLGMNRQFWGVAARGALPELVRVASSSTPAAVYTHDASPAWGLYRAQGLIPASLVDAGWEQGGIARSAFALVIHERHFNRHDYLIWSSYQTVQPIFVLRAAGVPIVSLYRRPALQTR